MRKGQLSRDEAIAEVGIEAVEAVDGLDCFATNRVQCDGDPNEEYRADYDCKDRHGEDVTLSVYYYQSPEALAAVNGLDQLDWAIDGYDIN